MKKLNRLFAILIAVLGVGSLSAQTWTAPVIGQDLKDVNNNTELYMYNVKADAFACSGMSWGTHATVKELQNGDTKLSADVHRCRVSKPTDGQLQIMLNERTWLGGGGPGSTNDCWVDHGSNNVYIYNEVSDNVYTLKPTTATNESYLDCAWAYGGHITFSATNGYGNTEWAFVLRSDITDGKYLLYKAKKEMYDIYQALKAAGHDGTYATALSTANKAYTASNATAASVNAATKKLLAEVAPALSSKFFAANSLFNNPDMRGYGDDTDWGNGLNAFADGIFESWHSAETITQTQTGLPNGFYTVVFLGMYRQDGGDAAPTLTLTSGNKSAKANLKSLTEIDFGNCSGGNKWTGANKPDNTYSAGEALAHTDAGVKVENFVVENGELTITVAMPSGNQWLLCQGFEIYYKAESLDEYANLFHEAKAKAEAFNAEELNTAAANQISAARSAAATEQVNKEWYQTRTEELNAAIALANEVKAPYANFKSLITLCESTLNNSEEFEAGAEDAFTTAINTAKNSVASATTAGDINAAYNAVEEARRVYIQKADPLNGELFDYTFMIANPGFDNGTNGWNCESNAQNKQTTNNKSNGIITGWFFENWNPSNFTGTISQSISGLPSGKYLLKVAAFGTGANVFANNEQVGVTSGDGVWYEVEVAVSEGTLTFGIKNENATNWIGIDNASLYYKGFDVETAKAGITSLITQAEALAAKPMNKDVLAGLNETIGDAREILNVAYPTRKELNTMIEELNHAMDNANASIAEYNTIATYIAKANAINESIAATYKTQYDNGTISESLETVFQKLEVATYNYVMSNFTYDAALSDDWNSTGVNTHAATFYDEHWSSERRAYKNQHDGWGDPKEGYPANSWSIDFDQEKTLPAGEYVFKVAGRKSPDATLELVVTMGETVLGTVNDFPSTNEGMGINKAGAASFDANDPAGFSKDGKGHGWQWRYVRFVLDSEATVKVAVHAETNRQYNWVSFADYTLQMTEETYLEANKGELDAPTARANELLNGPMGSSEKQALQAAINMTYTTGEQLYAKVHALNEAITKAEEWVAKYIDAKIPLVAALERFEADFNDAENGALAYMNKNIWADVIEKVQSAALAKDDFASHEGLTAAANELTAALDAAQASIDAYAALKIEVNSGNIPVKAENVANHAEYFEEAKSGYNNATIETDRANELVIVLQNYRVEDYNYVVENYVMSKELTDEWVGKTEKQSGEHWSGDAEIKYFDYSHWSGAGTYEATQSITLPAGEYVLMAAGRASSVEGTEAYIKVDDTKVNFAAKGSYGHGIATDGTATFASDASYAREGEGYGWEYRFVTFTLTEKKEVTLVAGMTIADSRDPLSWASVCTPVLLTPDPAAAQEALQKAIEVAGNVRDKAYPLGEEVFKISTKSDAYKSLVAAIATAQNVLETAATVSALNVGITELNAAVEAYKSNYVLNAPKKDQRYYIKVATEGHGKYGNAVLATLGATGDNNPTGYGLNANNAVKAHLNQAFIFTQVEGNLYNISIERAEGIVYLTYGALNGSAAGWKNQQIQATTDAEKKGEFKIEATAKEGVFKIKNTIDNNYLDCQDGGSIYTDTNFSNEEFSFELASESTVTLTLSKVGWATLILPFDAELPEGVKAWSCGEVNKEKNELTLNAVEDGIIRANTPYLINGDEGTYTFSGYGMADKDSYTDGLFTGTYIEYQTTANSNTYVLQKKTIDGKDDVAFYLVGESGQPKVNPNRIYMTYADAAGAPRFSFGRGGETTSIDNSQFTIDNEVVIYDIMGRKVNTMEKGKMYIVNGKKVIVK